MKKAFIILFALMGISFAAQAQTSLNGTKWRGSFEFAQRSNGQYTGSVVNLAHDNVYVASNVRIFEVSFTANRVNVTVSTMDGRWRKYEGYYSFDGSYGTISGLKDRNGDPFMCEYTDPYEEYILWETVPNSAFTFMNGYLNWFPAKVPLSKIQ